MSSRFFLFALLAFVPLAAFGQSRTIVVSVYFDTDSSALDRDAEETIDSTLQFMLPCALMEVRLEGHADSNADSSYNLTLSEQRTRSVEHYLRAQGVNSQDISTFFFGEDKPLANNGNEEGRRMNRRVDLLLSCPEQNFPTETEAPSNESPVLATDSCRSDTLIILPQGSQVLFNRCEFLEIEDCLDIVETNTADEILANGLSLMGMDESPIASCGMIKVEMKPGCTDCDCFKFPIKVRFPAPQNPDCDLCRINARVWDITMDGSWTEASGQEGRMELVEVEGQLFYQMQLRCPNSWKNCDCRFPKVSKTKVKIRRKYKYNSLSVTSECPTMVVEAKLGRRSNVAKLKLPCAVEEKWVVATIVDNKGDTLTLKKMPLNALKKRMFFSPCPKVQDEPIRRYFGLFPVWKRSLYRKYVIEPFRLQ